MILADELASDMFSHCFERPNGSSGVEVVARRGPDSKRMGAYHYSYDTLFRKGTATEFMCRLMIKEQSEVEMVKEGGFLGFFAKTTEVKVVKSLTFVAMYPRKAGRMSCAAFALSVPASDAERIKKEVLSNPNILFAVWMRVFPKEFAEESRLGRLQMDPKWADYVLTKES